MYQQYQQDDFTSTQSEYNPDYANYEYERTSSPIANSSTGYYQNYSTPLCNYSYSNYQTPSFNNSYSSSGVYSSSNSYSTSSTSSIDSPFYTKIIESDNNKCFDYTNSYNVYPSSPNYASPLQTVEKQKPKRTSSSRVHQSLPDVALDLMNEWFDDHISNPYPQQIEKERLAQLGGITIKQVTAWFSNRRNRSQNTKPKRMKRVIEQEMSQILNELVNNPNSDKQQVLDKFKFTLSAQH
jgi:hypothetical protein